MKKKKVYIAHEYGGKDENRLSAARWFLWACRLEEVMPIAPWIINTLILSEERRQEGMAINYEHIDECDELWICGTTISPGVKDEIAYAESKGKPVVDKRMILRW